MKNYIFFLRGHDLKKKSVFNILLGFLSNFTQKPLSFMFKKLKCSLFFLSNKGTAHCANMYPARSQDLPQLSLARDHVLLLLQQWLKN